jgi:hypothetical protein
MEFCRNIYGIIPSNPAARLGERPIKAETLEIGFSGKWGVDASKISPLFEIAFVLVRLDHVARLLFLKYSLISK